MLHFEVNIKARTEDYELVSFLVTNDEGLTFPVTVITCTDGERAVKISPFWGVDEEEVMVMIDYIMSTRVA